MLQPNPAWAEYSDALLNKVADGSVELIGTYRRWAEAAEFEEDRAYWTQEAQATHEFMRSVDRELLIRGESPSVT